MILSLRFRIECYSELHLHIHILSRSASYQSMRSLSYETSLCTWVYCQTCLPCCWTAKVMTPPRPEWHASTLVGSFRCSADQAYYLRSLRPHGSGEPSTHACQQNLNTHLMILTGASDKCHA